MSKQNRIDRVCAAYLATRLRIERLPNGDSVSTRFTVADVPQGTVREAAAAVTAILAAFPALHDLDPEIVGSSIAVARYGLPGLREMFWDTATGNRADAMAAAMGEPTPIFGEVR